MTKADKKRKAQDLIMHHLSTIGYGDEFEKYCKETGESETSPEILKQQMDRVAKTMGYEKAWFS